MPCLAFSLSSRPEFLLNVAWCCSCFVLSQVTDCLTSVKSVNKTDTLSLLSTFGVSEPVLCWGWAGRIWCFESSTPQQCASRKGSSVTPPSPQAVELHFPSALANVAKVGGMGLAVQQYLQIYLVLCGQAFPVTPRCGLVDMHSLPTQLPPGLMPANALGSFR